MFNLQNLVYNLLAVFNIKKYHAKGVLGILLYPSLGNLM